MPLQQMPLILRSGPLGRVSKDAGCLCRDAPFRKPPFRKPLPGRRISERIAPNHSLIAKEYDFVRG